MRKKSKWIMLLTYFVVVLALASNSSAADIYWDDGADPNELWSEPNNWDTNSVPTGDDDVWLNMADTNCLIDSSVDALCDGLQVGYDTGPCYLDMTGGSITAGYHIVLGEEPNGNGIFTMSGGTVSMGNRELFIANGSNTAGTPASYGTFIMTGGEFNAGNKVKLAKNRSAVGKMYMYDGAINFVGTSSPDFEFASYGTGTLYMYGGDVNVADKLRMGESAGTGTIYMEDGNIICNELAMLSDTSTIYLTGGDINCSTMDLSADTALIDINEGVLIVLTDGEEDEIKGYVKDGKIIGYHGEGIVDITSPGGGIGWITVTARMGDPNLAWSPNPKNYDAFQWTPTGPTLTWKPGQYADSHDVYFGTDRDDVNDANNSGSDPEFKGNQDPCSYGPLGPLVLGQTYYWRIDEVNENAWAPSGSPWKGDIWQFMIDSYLDVEDFDDYANDTELEAVWKLSGSDISLEDAIIRAGKSMKYVFELESNTEADANTTGPNSLDVITKDWETPDVNVKAMALHFYGRGDNNAVPMYVALRDTDGNLATVYYGNPNDLNKPEWREWNIKLSDFNSPNDVNLSDVDKVYIGFGKRENPAASTGSGTVYFDNIRLYPRRCVPVHAPKGDIDDDCDIDFVDFNDMLGDWHEKDSIRAGSHGELKGGASFVVDGARKCLELDGTDGWLDLDDSDFSNFRNKTIAFWVKVMDYPDPPYPYLFFFSNEDFIDEGETAYRIYIMTRTEDIVRARFVEGYSDDFTAAKIWRHLALVLEDTPEGCTGTLYADGYPHGAAMSGRPRHSGGAGGVNLGSEDDGAGKFLNARYDDFRVYDRALTDNEIEDLYYGIAPDANMLLHYTFDDAGTIAVNSSNYAFYHPLLSDAELYDEEAKDSREVNFKDLAILVSDWAKTRQWWP